MLQGMPAMSEMPAVETVAPPRLDGSEWKAALDKVVPSCVVLK